MQFEFLCSYLYCQYHSKHIVKQEILGRIFVYNNGHEDPFKRNVIFYAIVKTICGENNLSDALICITLR